VKRFAGVSLDPEAVEAGETHIRNSDRTGLVEHRVTLFDVPMDDLAFVGEPKSRPDRYPDGFAWDERPCGLAVAIRGQLIGGHQPAFADSSRSSSGCARVLW